VVSSELRKGVTAINEVKNKWDNYVAMGGNEYFMQVSVCFKYWLAFLIFGVSRWMIWREENGSWNALTLAKGIFPLYGSARVSAHPC
jgi:hypothetical protein